MKQVDEKKRNDDDQEVDHEEVLQLEAQFFDDRVLVYVV